MVGTCSVNGLTFIVPGSTVTVAQETRLPQNVDVSQYCTRNEQWTMIGFKANNRVFSYARSRQQTTVIVPNIDTNKVYSRHAVSGPGVSYPEPRLPACQHRSKRRVGSKTISLFSTAYGEHDIRSVVSFANYAQLSKNAQFCKSIKQT